MTIILRPQKILSAKSPDGCVPHLGASEGGLPKGGDADENFLQPKNCSMTAASHVDSLAAKSIGNAEMRNCRNAEMQKCRNAEMQKCRIAATQNRRNEADCAAQLVARQRELSYETQRSRPTATQQQIKGYFPSKGLFPEQNVFSSNLPVRALI